MKPFSETTWSGRTAALVLAVSLAMIGFAAGHQSANAATPSPSIMCPLADTPTAAVPGPIVSIPPCPPPCRFAGPVLSAPANSDLWIGCRCQPPVTTAQGNPLPILCRFPTTTTTTTTTTSTIPIDGWAIAGITSNRLCAGPTPQTGCPNPYQPASDTVTISRDGTIIAQTTSDTNGRFRVPVAPGTYTAQAGTTVKGAAVNCPTKTVVVSGPPIPTTITLHCTIQLP